MALPYNNILICDDHSVIRETIKSIINKLASDNCSLSLASSGSEALGFLEAKNFDLVIVDLEMPEFSGIELTSKIRSTDKNCRVVILTAHNNRVLVDAAKSYGANAFVTKSSPLEEIEDILSKLHTKDYFVTSDDLNQMNQSGTGQSNLFEQCQNLTSTERKVLELTFEGVDSDQIADRLFIVRKSVYNYRNRICRKLALPAENNVLNKWIIENREFLMVYFGNGNNRI